MAEREIIFIFAENLSKKHSMARENENSGCFVVTFPLKTEKWQEDRIDKILNLLTVRYHEKQQTLLDIYIHLSHSPEFKEAKNVGLKAFRNFMNEHNFTKFDVEKVFSDSSLSKSVTSDIMLTHGINSSIMQELSHRAWSAWEKKLYGQGKFIKLDNEVNSFKSRLKGSTITGFEYSFTDMTLSMNATKPKKHTMFTIPFIINRKSEYEIKSYV